MTGTSVAANPKLDRDLGAELRRTRRALRLSLQSVEHITGGVFKPSVLGSYERGERTISGPALAALCAAYGIHPSDIWDVVVPRLDATDTVECHGLTVVQEGEVA